MKSILGFECTHGELLGTQLRCRLDWKRIDKDCLLPLAQVVIRDLQTYCQLDP